MTAPPTPNIITLNPSRPIPARPRKTRVLVEIKK
jgi:hypothetical protein